MSELRTKSLTLLTSEHKNKNIQNKSLSLVLDSALAKKSIEDFDEQESRVFQLCMMLMNIQYRHKHGDGLDNLAQARYSKNTIKKALGSQVSPVEDGFLGM